MNRRVRHFAALAALVALAACSSRARRTTSAAASTAAATEGATSSSSGSSGPREPAPVRLAAPTAADRALRAVEQPTRWTTNNGVSIEHRRFALASTVHLRLVVRGHSADPAPGAAMREGLRLAAALEAGATRRNAAPLFFEALDRLGAELRVDAGRQGLVLSLDVASRNAVAAIRRLGELASEAAPSRELPTYSEWVARRLPSSRARNDANDAIVVARRAAIGLLRATDAPWSPREWSDAASSWSWGPATAEDNAGRALVRALFRAGSMTLVVAGDISLEDARAALTERWSSVARGPGLSVLLVTSTPSSDGSQALRVEAAVAQGASLAVGVSLASDGSPATVVALRVLAPVLERCAARDLRVSFYDDPARPIVAIAANITPTIATAALVARVESLLNEPTRALAGACAEGEFASARNALIDLAETDDSERWADARAWARHDAIDPIDQESMRSALAALDLERARSVFRTAVSRAVRSVVIAGPLGLEGSLCAVPGVRSVRVGAADRPCPR